MYMLCTTLDPILLEVTVHHLEEMQNVMQDNQDRFQQKIMQRLDNITARLQRLERDYRRHHPPGNSTTPLLVNSIIQLT